MKIAVFGHKRIPSREGGVEIVAEELSTRMAALGHSVTCYNRKGHHVGGAGFDAEAVEAYKGVTLKTVLTIDKKGLAAVSSSFFAALRCAFSDARVVHIHAEGPGFMCWLPKLFRKRVVVTIHGLDWQREKWKSGFGSRYIRWGEKMIARYADAIIVLSKNVQQYFQDTYGRQTYYISNGVSRPRRMPADQIRTEYGLEADEYILFLGRLVPEKGIHYLLDAYQQMNTDKKLVIAGGASDTNAYVQELKRSTQSSGKIIFTGFVQGQILEELYSNAWIYVLPSDLEGMPLSLLEAMSYGNCCVVSDIPECAEVVEDKAAVFPRGNTAALRDCLQRLCDSPDIVRNYREDAADFICKKYNWDAVTEQTLKVYGETQ